MQRLAIGHSAYLASSGAGALFLLEALHCVLSAAGACCNVKAFRHSNLAPKRTAAAPVKQPVGAAAHRLMRLH